MLKRRLEIVEGI